MLRYNNWYTGFGGMMHNLQSIVKKFSYQIRDFRRHIHKFPETGWNEYATTAYVVKFLQQLGYEVRFGANAIKAGSRLTPPSAEHCKKERARAINQGADAKLVEQMGDGLTGLWVDIACPNDQTKGPIIALRFDLDAIGTVECHEQDHKPTQEGFASCNHGSMHACGHDGHVAIGLGLALVLHEIRHQLKGVVRLIFQPSEEIGQGAKAMLDAGVMQGVNELIGLHLGVQAKELGTIIGGTTDFLAVSSFEISYHGKAAHAGLAPHEGQNSLMAAMAAIQGIHSIPRHGDGASRLNIGQLIVDGSPNIVPSKAWFAGETRGINCEVSDWMFAEVKRISKAAADMWGCTHELHRVGSCISGYSDESLAQDVCKIAEEMPFFTKIIPSARFLASEDFTWLLKDVQSRGGQGTYIQIGTALAAGHHNEKFDFDEAALEPSVELLARLVLSKLDLCKVNTP